MATTNPPPKLYKRSGRRMLAVKFTAEDVAKLEAENRDLKRKLNDHLAAIVNLCRAIDKDETRQAAQNLIDLLPK